MRNKKKWLGDQSFQVFNIKYINRWYEKNVTILSSK